LTVDKICKLQTCKEYYLKIPNVEIRDSIRLELSTSLLVPSKNTTPQKFLNQKYLQFLEAFGTRDEKKCELYLSAIFAGIIQGSSEKRNGRLSSIKTNESFFRPLLQLLLEFGNKLSIPESFSDIGRSDLAVQGPRNEWVSIEIKHEATELSVKHAEIPLSNNNIIIVKRSKYVNLKLQKLINRAFLQIVKKKYTEKFLAEGSKVYAAAVAINGSSDVMVKFKKVVWADKDNGKIGIA
jgi:hypothetical protein